ncbi:hypothetical protein SNE35_18230 [Paucibacter sp. R3-3]|uniref:Uncharacterized protein n=1 Tax=Roseateles agri TaxID=3098619 RepID=A0ABU5DJI0_9BURK|nr:hypothetical protein [Paucibacter sp. R3-3]MDY0746456.1 hypothetical protein [Paucibacter sp. R3-3]
MPRTTLLLAALLFTGVAHAADDKRADTPPVKPGWTVLPDQVDSADVEPKVEDSVIEDEHTRIEQLRVRGQTQRVKVHKKNGPIPVPDYEIVMGNASYDWTFEAGGTRFSIGRSVWRVLDF